MTASRLGREADDVPIRTDRDAMACLYRAAAYEKLVFDGQPLTHDLATIEAEVGEKVVGVGLLDLATDTARFDLWCPDGMRRHDVSTLDFQRTGVAGPATAASTPRVR